MQKEGDRTARVAGTEWHTHPAYRGSTSWRCYRTWLTFYGTPSAASLYSPCWDTTIRTQDCNSDRVTRKWLTCGGTGCPRRQSRPSTKVRMYDNILSRTNGGPAMVYASVTDFCGANCLNNREFYSTVTYFTSGDECKRGQHVTRHDKNLYLLQQRIICQILLSLITINHQPQS